MRIILYCFFIFSIISCSYKESDLSLISYKTQTISEASFIKKLMFKSLSIYGSSFIENLHKQEVFDDLKLQTLSDILDSFIVNQIASEKNIIIKDAELNTWIKSRTGTLDEKERDSFLKISKHSLAEWRKEFKDQLLKKKVLDSFNTNKKPASKKKDQKKVKSYLIGVLTFSSKIEAETTYKTLLSSPNKFDSLLSNLNGSNSFYWVKEANIPFLKKISNTSKGKFTKPFETEWGHLIVKVKAKKAVAFDKKNNASSQVPAKFIASIAQLKKDPLLKINHKRIYGLSILN